MTICEGHKAYSMLSRHQDLKLVGAAQSVAASSVGTQASGPAGKRQGSWTAASKWSLEAEICLPSEIPLSKRNECALLRSSFLGCDRSQLAV